MSDAPDHAAVTELCRLALEDIENGYNHYGAAAEHTYRAYLDLRAKATGLWIAGLQIREHPEAARPIFDAEMESMKAVLREEP